MKRQLLSSNELAILTALWEAGQPLSRPQLLERITKTDWNPNSINVILNNMIKKGYIAIGMSVRHGTHYGRTYYPLKSREECIISLATFMLPNASEEERALRFMTAMTKSKGISEAAIQEMERMLEQRRKELQQEKAELEKEKKE